jgi:hypothetical protein
VADLDSKEFAVRQAASKELRQLGAQAEPQLRQVLSRAPSAESRRRIERLLQGIEDRTEPEALRQGRALHVLERLATPAARELLAELAKGDAAAALTQQAGEALRRVTQRGRVVLVPGAE